MPQASFAQSDSAVQTQADLAKRIGVSQVTVQRALAGHPAVRESTRSKVMAGVKKYGYRPHAAARMMRTRRSRQVGILLRNAIDAPMTNLGAFEIVLGINASLEQSDHLATIVRIGDVSSDGRVESRVFSEQLLDGMVMVGQFPDAIIQRINHLMPRCVWVESPVWRPRNCVRRDEVYNGQLVAKKLVDAGYERFVWVGRKREISQHFSEDDRLLGVESVAREHGIEVDHLDLAVDRVAEPMDLDRVKKLMRPGVGLITYGAIRARQIAFLSHSLGLCLGRDFGLVSCEDTHEDSIAWPELSCVHIDRFEMGKMAGQMMIDSLDDPDTPCVSKLVQGDWHQGETAPDYQAGSER